MTATLYLWLLGAVLIALGGALVGRGWWMDKVAGNHLKARCRKCWYTLEAVVPGADGSRVCPECGAAARSTHDLHRVRRRWGTSAVGLLTIAGGLYLSGQPLLSGGRWLFMLPRAISARLWQPLGAESYGRAVRQRVANGTAIEAELESVQNGAKGLVLRAAKTPNTVSWTDVGAALHALGAARPDPEVDKAAAELLLTNGALAREAVAYFKARQLPAAELIAVVEPVMAAAKLTGPPTEYYELLEKSSADPDALAALVRAASASNQWANWAQQSVLQAGEPGLKAIETAFKAATDGAQRKRLAALFLDAFPYARSKNFSAFIAELAEDPGTRAVGQQLIQFHGDLIDLPDQTVKSWIMGDDQTLQGFALQHVGCHGNNTLPEGCGERVLALSDKGVAMPCWTLQRFSGADRALWVGRAKEGRIDRRRAACQTLALMRPPSEEAVAALRAIEADRAESEEMRVAARDALRQLGAWEK